MSLTARVAVAASRWIDLLAAGLLVAGVSIATVTVAARWPPTVPALPIVAVLATALAVDRRLRAARPRRRATIVVSRAGDIAVFPDIESGDEETWGVTESTMIWPGFSMLAFTRDDDGSGQGARGWRSDGSMSLPVFDAELDPADRRALGRVLLWSLRGGEGARAADARRAAAG